MTEPNLELFNEIAKRINPSPWQQQVICELIEKYNPWHTGTPTEEGDYICAFRQSDDSIEYGWCEWDGNGFDILCDYDPLVTPIVAWMPIPPYKDK